MGPEVVNRNKDSNFYGPYAGRDQYIIMLEDKEREFVVTHNANIKPVSYFTGREAELQELRQRIEAGRKSVLVSGMGGIGKTHICRKLFEEYLNKHAEDENGPFRHIGYIEYSGDMGSSLQNCLKFKQQDVPEQNQEAAWRELEDLAAGGKLLLFVDNVDKPISADPGLQKLKEIPGAVILTSRQVSFGDEFELYPIGFLGMKQCIEIYEKIRFGSSERKVKPEEVPDLEYVIESLAGRHTITVEHLAHLARTKTWPVRKLREKLEEKGFCLEFHKDGEFVNIQKSYEALYDLSGLTEAEKNILEAFSVFPYIPLATEICNEWLLTDAGVGDDDILIGLFQKGWLQLDMEQEGYALHPVFAQFIYEKCKPELEKHRGLIEACQRRLKIPESGSASECQKYIPFAENMIEKLGMGNNSPFSEKCSHCSGTLIWNRLYSFWDKTKTFIRNLRGTKFRKERDNLDQVNFISAVAYLSYYIAEYKKAEALYRKSLRISERVLGEEHPDTATIYNNLAGVYESQGEYKKAEVLYEKSLRIRERALGEEHPDTATSYNNLAYVYVKQGEYKKAEALYEKSLRISERVLGEEHPDTVTSYNNLAGVYAGQGEYKKAEGLFERGLRISERVLGEEHPSTATSYNNLAEVYMSQGEYKKAEVLYEKSLRIRERVLGEEHPDTATIYNNLAAVYADQGEYKKAEGLYEKSLRIRERVLGEEHPSTATIYNNLATMCFDQKKYKLALRYIIKAYKVCINKLGFEHPHAKIYYQNMKIAYAEWNPKGNFE